MQAGNNSFLHDFDLHTPNFAFIRLKSDVQHSYKHLFKVISLLPSAPHLPLFLVCKDHLMEGHHVGLDVVEHLHGHRLSDQVHAEVVFTAELHEEAHGPQVVGLVVLLSFRAHKDVLWKGWMLYDYVLNFFHLCRKMSPSENGMHETGSFLLSCLFITHQIQTILVIFVSVCPLLCITLDSLIAYVASYKVS